MSVLKTASKVYKGANLAAKVYAGSALAWPPGVPWTPANLGVNLLVWLDGSDAATITVAGSGVGNWANKGGSSFTASQATDAWRPSRGANYVNFAGPQFLAVGNRFPSYDLFLVGRPIVDNSDYRSLMLSGDQANVIAIMPTGADTYGVYSGVFKQAGTLTWTGGADGLAYGRVAPAGDVLLSRDGGALFSTGLTTTGDTGPISLGSSAGYGGGGVISQAWGRIYEFILATYNSPADTKQKLEGYGAWKYGFQSLLPAGHPYKAAPPVYSGAFDPSIIPGLNIWLDASTLGLADGAVVSSWTNLGAGPATVVDAASPYATYKAGSLNGKGVVRLNANGTRIRFTGTGVAKDWTVIYVARMWGSNTIGRVVGALYPSGGNVLLGFWNGFTDIAYITGGAGFFVPDTRQAVNTSWRMYSADCATPAVAPRLFSNGVLLGSHPAPPATDGWGGTFNISGLGTDLDETCDCEIAEVLLYNRKLTDAERQSVEGYLRTKWGIV